MLLQNWVNKIIIINRVHIMQHEQMKSERERDDDMWGQKQGYVCSLVEENMARTNSQKGSFLHNRGHTIGLGAYMVRKNRTRGPNESESENMLVS